MYLDIWLSNVRRIIYIYLSIYNAYNILHFILLHSDRLEKAIRKITPRNIAFSTITFVAVICSVSCESNAEGTVSSVIQEVGWSGSGGGGGGGVGVGGHLYNLIIPPGGSLS